MTLILITYRIARVVLVSCCSWSPGLVARWSGLCTGLGIWCWILLRCTWMHWGTFLLVSCFHRLGCSLCSWLLLLLCLGRGSCRHTSDWVWLLWCLLLCTRRWGWTDCLSGCAGTLRSCCTMRLCVVRLLFLGIWSYLCLVRCSRSNSVSS